VSRYRLSPQAADDVREIWGHIAEENLEAAGRVRRELRDSMERLSRHPKMGHARKDLTDRPVLFWAVRSYLIVYNPLSIPLEVVRVLHGARDITQLLP